MSSLKGYFSVILLLFFHFSLFSQSTDIVINEFMAINTTYAQDEEGQFDDYIEIRNNSTTNWKNLKNWTLTDTLGIPDKWTFPDDATLEPHGYLVLWADEDGGQGDFHVNFKLDGDGEELYLFDQHGNMVDQIVFGQQVEDMSFSRIPNGTGDFVVKEGTIGFNNEFTSSVEDAFVNPFTIYPNPTSDLILVSNESQKISHVEIFDLIGNSVIQRNIENKEGMVDLSHLSVGMYIITINGKYSDRLIKL